MSTPDERARDKDRDAAIKIVEAAWANGQIVEADRDKRVEELGRARTLSEISMMTHDLQRSGPAAAAESPPAQPPSVYTTMPYRTPASDVLPEEPVPVPPPVSYGPPMPTDSTTAVASTVKLPKLVFILPLIVVAVIGIAVVGGIVGLVNSATDGSGLSTGGDAEVLTESGYADLLDAVADEAGSTEAFSAVLYPTYAVVELPVDPTTQRSNRYYWDGDLTDQDSKSTSSDDRFDMRSIDPAVIVSLVNKVRRLSDEPTTWYAVLSAPRDSDRTMIWAYASNEYNESVYIGARRDGTVVYDSTKP